MRERKEKSLLEMTAETPAGMAPVAELERDTDGIAITEESSTAFASSPIEIHAPHGVSGQLRSPGGQTPSRAPAQIAIDRELMGVLMRDGWLGLRLLDTLREFPDGLEASALAGHAGCHVDACLPILAQLVEYGAVGIVGRRFVVSERGGFVLQRIDEITEKAEPAESVVLETA